MNKYSYEARDAASNKIVKSTVQAESEIAAAKKNVLRFLQKCGAL